MQALEPFQSAFPEDKESLFESSHCIFDGEMLRNDGLDLHGPRSGGGQSITFDDFASSFATTPSSSESYSYQPTTTRHSHFDESLLASPMDAFSSSSSSTVSSASFNPHDRQASWDLSLDTRRNTLDSVSSFNSAAPSTISSSNSEWSFDELLPSSLLGGLGLETTPMGQWKGRSLPAQDNHNKKMEVDAAAPFLQKDDSTVQQPTILDTKFTVSTPMSMYTDEMDVLRGILASKSHVAPQQSTHMSFDHQDASNADTTPAPTLPSSSATSYPFTSSEAAIPPLALSSSSQSFDFAPPPQPALSSVPLPSLPPTTSDSSLLSLSQLQVDPLLATTPSVTTSTMPRSTGFSLVPVRQQPLSDSTNSSSSSSNDSSPLLSQRRNALPSSEDEKTLQAIALANSILSHQTEKKSSSSSNKPLKPPMFGRMRREAFFDTVLSPKSVVAPSGHGQGHNTKQDAVKAEEVEEEYRPHAEPVNNNSLYDVLAQWQFAGDRAAAAEQQQQQQSGKEVETNRKRKGESEQGPVKLPKAGRGGGGRRRSRLASTCSTSSSSSSSSSSDDDDDQMSSLATAHKNKRGRRKSEKVERRDIAMLKEEMRQALEKRRFSSSSGGSGAASKASLKKYKDGFSITDNIVLADPTGFEKDEVRYPTDESLWEMAHGAAGPLSMADAETRDGEGSNEEEGDKKLEPTITERQVGSSPEEQMDLYTPRWSRGNYPAREGWCHLCEHGGWYSMKRSQYLYHLQYDHGVSSTTKRVYEAPQAMRVWNDAVQSIELRCGHCNLWIPLSFGPSRKRSFKVWFKHAHACHLRKS